MASKTTSFSFIPSPGWCLLAPLSEDSGTLIHVKEVDRDPPKLGTVQAIGADYITEYGSIIKSPVKLGQTVYHKSIGFETIKLQGKEYRVVPFINIIGIWNEKNLN